MITALATPGHGEHMAYLVADANRRTSPARSHRRSLFVGDLARPDLAVEPEEGARGLYHCTAPARADRLRRGLAGHVGGSLCGGAGMSEKPGTTIGFERRFNRFLRIDDEGEFVRALTRDLAPQRQLRANRGAESRPAADRIRRPRAGRAGAGA